MYCTLSMNTPYTVSVRFNCSRWKFIWSTVIFLSYFSILKVVNSVALNLKNHILLWNLINIDVLWFAVCGGLHVTPATTRSWLKSNFCAEPFFIMWSSAPSGMALLWTCLPPTRLWCLDAEMSAGWIAEWNVSGIIVIPIQICELGKWQTEVFFGQFFGQFGLPLGYLR